MSILTRLKNETIVEAPPHKVINSRSDTHDGARFGLDLTLCP